MRLARGVSAVLLTVTTALSVQAQQVPPDLAHVTLSPAARHGAIQLAFDNFWGTGVLSSGATVQPASDQERETLPIPEATADSITAAAVPAGLGAWCGLDWERYYEAYMKWRRAEPWSETQLAFIGLLFGVAQGRIEEAFKTQPCTEAARDTVSTRLRAAYARAMPAHPEGGQ